jgi:hypothetical protein
MAVGCGAPAKPTETAPSAATPAAPTAKPAFENPGGMWMPRQIASHAETLRKLGLAIDPAALTDPLAPPLAAVVTVGGCTASFVSPEGLIVTNHHCVQGTLQYLSNPQANLVEQGYLARTRADELWNGPSARVFVTQALTDVTEKMVSGLEAVGDDQKRFTELESRQKTLIAECEKDRPHLRCSIESFFRGAEYYLIEQLEIRDVRLVYAPPRSAGAYGGDIDNWMWPRHTADFSIYRAYVGKDGKPADHAADNVAYRPAHHLKIASQPLAKGDLVFVAGYPARTFRHRTADEVAFAIERWYPERIEAFEELIAALREVSKQGEDVSIKAANWIGRFENALKNNRGTLENLQKGGLVERKQALEQELRAWAEQDAERRARYGEVLERLAALRAEERQTHQRDNDLARVAYPELMSAARIIVRMADERAKPDGERDIGYQQRTWPRIEASLRNMTGRYQPTLDRALLTVGLRRAVRHADANREWLVHMLGKAHDEAAGDEVIRPAVARIYDGTKLADEAVRVKLFQTATMQSLRKSKDPLIQIALATYPLQRAIEDRDERLAGALAVIEPRYVEALRAFHGGELAPDANATLRVTYGTVRGYRPRPEAPVYEPFTTLSGMLAKHTGQKPFDAPERVLEAARAGRFGHYVDATLGEIPVNFLSDVDTTGGNSGSPTLNARGELTGLLFDGNYEAMSSDWQFMPALTRSIHLDIRYALWMLDVVENAQHLLQEMGVPSSAAEAGSPTVSAN